MQRLSTVHPSDTSKFPLGEGTFDIGAANEGSKILLKNFTPLNLDLDFLNGSTDMLHAWEINYWTLDADTKQIQWQIDADSLNVSAPPISAVFMTLYDASEQIKGTYPAFATVQTSLGGGSLNTLSNETSPSGSKIIDIGVPGFADLMDIFNNGQMLLKFLDSGGVNVHQFLQISTSGIGAGPHGLQLGNPSASGILDAANIYNLVAQNLATFLQGITLAGGNAGITLLAGSISRMNTFTASLNNAFALINHGLGVVPDNVIGTEQNTLVDATPGNLIYDPSGSSITQARLCWNAGASARNIICTAIKS